MKNKKKDKIKKKEYRALLSKAYSAMRINIVYYVYKDETALLEVMKQIQDLGIEQDKKFSEELSERQIAIFEGNKL